jgi:hypothetical protein
MVTKMFVPVLVILAHEGGTYLGTSSLQKNQPSK